MSKSVFQQREENLMTWVGYWRANIHRFVEDYLGMNLFLYQKILIYMIDKYTWFMYIAARGQGRNKCLAYEKS